MIILLKKTLKRIRSRFLRLPLHHIDTSVILEPETTKTGRDCKRYLNKVGYKYRAKFSLPMLGELFYDILELEDPNDRYTALDFINSLVDAKQIEFSSVPKTERISQRIREVDEQIDPLDRLIFACAIADKAKNFVTLDSKFLKNKKLETEFKIKISHPKDLL